MASVHSSRGSVYTTEAAVKPEDSRCAHRCNSRTLVMRITSHFPSQPLLSKRINPGQSGKRARDSWKAVSEHPAVCCRLQTSVPAANPVHTAPAMEERMVLPRYHRKTEVTSGSVWGAAGTQRVSTGGSLSSHATCDPSHQSRSKPLQL